MPAVLLGQGYRQPFSPPDTHGVTRCIFSHDSKELSPGGCCTFRGSNNSQPILTLTPHGQRPVGVTSAAIRNTARRVLQSWKHWSCGLELNWAVVVECTTSVEFKEQNFLSLSHKSTLFDCYFCAWWLANVVLKYCSAREAFCSAVSHQEFIRLLDSWTKQIAQITWSPWDNCWSQSNSMNGGKKYFKPYS